MSKTKTKWRQKRIWKKELKVSWSRKAHRRDRVERINENFRNNLIEAILAE